MTIRVKRLGSTVYGLRLAEVAHVMLSYSEKTGTSADTPVVPHAPLQLCETLAWHYGLGVRDQLQCRYRMAGLTTQGLHAAICIYLGPK